MLVPHFDLAESEKYDNLSSEDVFNMMSVNKENLDFKDKNVFYHINKEKYNPDREVKIRILSN